MNTKIIFSATILLGSALLPTVSFGAYGWWWWWSSISSSSVSSTSVLTKDVCNDWDYSNDYYDWTCWTKPAENEGDSEVVITPISQSFTTQSVKKQTPFIFNTETKNQLKKLIQEKQTAKKQDISSVRSFCCRDITPEIGQTQFCIRQAAIDRYFCLTGSDVAVAGQSKTHRIGAGQALKRCSFAPLV